MLALQLNPLLMVLPVKSSHHTQMLARLAGAVHTAASGLLLSGTNQ
jgi:hypothetical protein